MLKLISGDFTIEERSMLEVTTSDDAAKRILNPFALNEVAILKQELASMISVEAMLNGEPLHNYYCGRWSFPMIGNWTCASTREPALSSSPSTAARSVSPRR